MSGSDIVADAAARALLVVLEVAAPVVVPVVAAALIVGLVQAATSINEASLSFIPKLLAAAAALAFGGALMLRFLTDFTLDLYAQIPNLLR